MARTPPAATSPPAASPGPTLRGRHPGRPEAPAPAPTVPRGGQARLGRAGPELLVVLAIKAVNGIGLAAVLLLGKGVLDGVIMAGSSGAEAELVLPQLLLLTVVGRPSGSCPPSAGSTADLAELTSRHAQSQIIDVAREVELGPTTPRPSTTGWSRRPPAASSGPGRSSRR